MRFEKKAAKLTLKEKVVCESIYPYDYRKELDSVKGSLIEYY